MNNNIILQSDSYKASHYLQYPQNSQGMFSYIESRTPNTKLIFFGLQYYLKKYFAKPINQNDINQAETILTAHGMPFNREGWEYILNEYNGYLPITIKAFKEGEIVPSQVPIITVECQDPKVFWIVSYIETILLKVWYPITVATISKNIKNLFEDFTEKSSDNPEGIDFKLHDFGARGASSDESAGIGGMAHLMNFRGTDTMTALLYAQYYYNADMAGFSIPASEHSTMTSWTKENEIDAYRNMIKQFGKENAIFAVVSDSYDYFNTIDNIWGGELKQDIINSGATLVIRPDSGIPIDIVKESLIRLERKFGTTINSKGYKILNYVRIIQGDGVNPQSINEIIEMMNKLNFSIDNVAFGMGAALLQKVNRDTFNFAMKTSAIKVNNEWIDVFKDPITDQGKKSKAGRITTIEKDGQFKYVRIEQVSSYKEEGWNEPLQIIFENGKIIKEYKFENIRN